MEGKKDARDPQFLPFTEHAEWKVDSRDMISMLMLFFALKISRQKNMSKSRSG